MAQPDDEPDYDRIPIGRLLSVAGTMLADRWRQLASRNDISVTNAVILFELVAEDGLSHREVARRCWLSPASVTAIADQLEREELVQRVRNPNDRRVVRLYVTDAGEAYAKRAAAILAEHYGSVFPRVSAADERVIRRYLVDLIRTVSNEHGVH